MSLLILLSFRYEYLYTACAILFNRIHFRYNEPIQSLLKLQCHISKIKVNTLLDAS